MLEITTNKTKTRKKLLLDGYTYMVRPPGAGESLDLAQFGKEVEKLDTGKLTPEQNDKLTDRSMQSLKIILSFFDPLESEEAKDYLRTIDPEELMRVVKQVFDAPTTS